MHVKLDCIIYFVATLNVVLFCSNSCRWILKLAQAAIMLGRTLAFSIALLFIPVSRSSPIMRMLDVPFEHAVKYHKWLGHITLTIVFAHSAIFITIFSYENNIAHVCFIRPFPSLSALQLESFQAGVKNSSIELLWTHCGCASKLRENLKPWRVWFWIIFPVDRLNRIICFLDHCCFLLAASLMASDRYRSLGRLHSSGVWYDHVDHFCTLHPCAFLRLVL